MLLNLCRPLLVALVLTLLATLATQAADKDAKPEKVKKVLYLGIDGCRFDSIGAAKTPNLDKLMENGCYTGQCLILGDRYKKNDTISGPGWSTILTGVWADKHGVHDNEFKGKNYTEYPHFFARLKEVQPDAYTVSIVDWIPIQQHIVSSADVGAVLPPIDGDYVKTDEAGSKAAVKILAERDPTVLFYYIGQVDESGHKHGFHPTVPEYISAIETADKHVGEVLTAVQNRQTYADEDWLVVVTSDHGGKGTGHGGGHNEPDILNSFLIVSGDDAQRGQIEESVHLVDAVATVLAHLGVKPKEEWKLDGHPVGLK
ncbi:MAG: alkaline phosphatase family protein [Pirellulales bacterium]|nr:alkaline phosphatase family protein [Pirellulales bacterium]